MKSAVSTSIFWKTPADCQDYCSIIKSAGFDYIELDSHSILKNSCEPRFLFLNAGQKIEVRSDAIQSGSRIFLECPKIPVISSVHMPYTYPISVSSKRIRALAVKNYAAAIEKIIDKIELPRTTPLILVFHPGIHCDKAPYYEQKQAVEEGIKELGALFGYDRRFALAFENMLSSHFASTVEDIIEIATMAESYIKIPSGICFDSCHAAYDNLSHEFLEKIIDKVISVHLSDNYNQSNGEFHAVPMSLMHSKIDWRRIAKLLYGRLEIMTLELSKPPFVSYEAYLKMAKIAADELESFMEKK